MVTNMFSFSEKSCSYPEMKYGKQDSTKAIAAELENNGIE